MGRNSLDSNFLNRGPGRRSRKMRDKTSAGTAPRQIFISQYDMDRLRPLIESGSGEETPYLQRLREGLAGAKLVQPKEVPEDIITMNSVVRVKDLDTGEETIYRLVFPAKAGAVENAISVLAPMGTALLGCREGDVIDCEGPGGTRRLQVLELVYQPERLGNYVL